MLNQLQNRTLATKTFMDKLLKTFQYYQMFLLKQNVVLSLASSKDAPVLPNVFWNKTSCYLSHLLKTLQYCQMFLLKQNVVLSLASSKDAPVLPNVFWNKTSCYLSHLLKTLQYCQMFLLKQNVVFALASSLTREMRVVWGQFQQSASAFRYAGHLYNVPA